MKRKHKTVSCCTEKKYKSQPKAVLAINKMIEQGKVKPGELRVYNCLDSLCAKFHIKYIINK